MGRTAYRLHRGGLEGMSELVVYDKNGHIVYAVGDFSERHKKLYSRSVYGDHPESHPYFSEFVHMMNEDL